MRDQHTRTPRAQRLEALKHLKLRSRIKRGGGFVEHQQLRVAHVRPGDRQLLPLTTRQLHAGRKSLADRLIILRRQPRNHLRRQALLGRLHNARAVLALVDAPHGDILAGGKTVAHEVLKDHAHVGA